MTELPAALTTLIEDFKFVDRQERSMLLIEFAADGTVVRTGTVEAATTRGTDEAVMAWVARAKQTTP